MQEREKQIEEMAKTLNEATFGVNAHTLADYLKPETVNKVAEYLYNAGYRKQSEGENISGYPSLFECSVCHWRDDDTYTGDTSEYNYCPNCGAKMKGGAE